MSTKLDALRQVVEELGAAFPDLTPEKQIYLVPKIMTVPNMANLELQVCEDASRYDDITGGCRSEDFIVLVGIFRKYRLDSGERHSKALSDLNLSLYQLKEQVISPLDGNFLEDINGMGDETGKKPPLLTRPLIIKSESAITDAGDGQLLKVVGFLAGLNSIMGEE